MMSRLARFDSQFSGTFSAERLGERVAKKKEVNGMRTFSGLEIRVASTRVQSNVVAIRIQAHCEP